MSTKNPFGLNLEPRMIFTIIFIRVPKIHFSSFHPQMRAKLLL